ncbi:MAG: hypothetical protein U0271_21260 [Polyangiaceae bacterium]
MADNLTASPTTESHASTEERTIPIVVVPGFMGTRLYDSVSKKLVWNPTGGGWGGGAPGDFAADATRLVNLTPLDPVEPLADASATELADNKAIPHYSNLVPDYYQDLCAALRDLSGLADAEAETPAWRAAVYVCGYDWRLSAADAATRLQTVVAEARTQNGREKVIIVAHCQGGLVSRYYSRKLGGRGSIRAMFLIGSPILGAVSAYTTMKAGLPLDTGDWRSLFVRGRMLLGQTGSRDLLRALPGAYEMLPTRVYCENNKSWLTFDASQSGYPYKAGNDPQPLDDSTTDYPQVFKDIFLGFGDDALNRTKYAQRVEAADLLHEQLKVQDSIYLHPRTYRIGCFDQDTSSSVELPSYGSVTVTGGENVYTPETNWLGQSNGPTFRVEVGRGDGAVTEYSLNPPAEILWRPFATFISAPAPISDTDHQALPYSADVIRQVTNEIPLIIALHEDDTDAGDDPVAPNGCKSCRAPITADQLKQLFPKGTAANVDEAVTAFNDYFIPFELASCLRKAHFWAQVAAETKPSLEHGTEDLTQYTLTGKVVSGQRYYNLTNVTVEPAKNAPYNFQLHPTLATKYAGTGNGDANAEQIANVLYGGWVDEDNSVLTEGKTNVEKLPDGRLMIVRSGKSDMGNHQPGDGWAFRGRGYIQLTGRNNYTRSQKVIDEVAPESGIDLIQSPDDAASTAKGSMVSTFGWWKSYDANSVADRGWADSNVDELFRLVNGAKSTEFDQRRRDNFHKAKVAFKLDECPGCKTD